MKFNIRGQKLTVTDSIKKYIEEKIGKLDKYFEKPEELSANVVIRVRGKEQIVEVTIPSKKVILRAEETSDDLYSSIDLVSDKLERQIRKNKTKMHSKNVKPTYENFIIDFEIEKEEDNDKKIVKRKQLDTKPMTEEEAILQMELLDHPFFIFNDAKRGEISVVYKRKDGNYGVIETK